MYNVVIFNLGFLMKLNNSSRSFDILSFSLTNKVKLKEFSLPKGLNTIKKVNNNYHYFTINKFFKEEYLGQTSIISAKEFFKIIEGTNFKEEEDSLNDI